MPILRQIAQLGRRPARTGLAIADPADPAAAAPGAQQHEENREISYLPFR
jgi:hypothetical protein